MNILTHLPTHTLTHIITTLPKTHHISMKRYCCIYIMCTNILQTWTLCTITLAHVNIYCSKRTKKIHQNIYKQFHIQFLKEDLRLIIHTQVKMFGSFGYRPPSLCSQHQQYLCLRYKFKVAASWSSCFCEVSWFRWCVI